MRMIKKFLCFTVYFLGCAPQAFAVATISMASMDKGVFVLQGAVLERVGGIDITVGYDTSTLTNPRVVQGGLVTGGIAIANTDMPGSVRIAIIHPKGITGTGSIATVAFDLSGASSGKITSLSADLIDTQGSKMASQIQVPEAQVVEAAETANPVSRTDSNPTSVTSPSQTTSAASPSQTAWLGSVTMPSDTTGSANDKGQDSPPQQAPSQPEQDPLEIPGNSDVEREREIVEPPSAAAETRIAYKSALECFKENRGEKTPKALAALFEGRTIPAVRQEPPIAISDGTSTVKVFIDVVQGGKDLPQFLLKGAKLESLKMEGKNTYLLEIKPDLNTYEAAVTILHNHKVTEVPLTVSPPMGMKKSGKQILSEENFKAFLKRSGTEKASGLDLNGDGVWNYIDEYILTANFLVRNKR